MERDMARQRDLYRVESQERIVLRERERSRSHLEKMSTGSAKEIKTINTEDANIYGNLRINRRQELLRQQRDQDEFLKIEAMTIDQEQTKQENENLKMELQKMVEFNNRKGHSERKKSCFEIALKMEIVPQTVDKSMVSL